MSSARSSGSAELPRAARRLGRSVHLLVAAVLFFFAPLLAYLGGSRPVPLENRPLAPLPAPGPGFVAGLERWGADHLPWRDVAVRAHATLAIRVFGEAPDLSARAVGPGPVAPVPQQAGARAEAGAGAGATSPAPAAAAPAGSEPGGSYPRVRTGTDGWLYYGGDVRAACAPAMDLDAVFAGWRRLVSVIEASGRRLVVTVAPDKTTLAPHALPPRYAGQQCSSRHRARVWDRLRGGELGPAYLDLREPLERRQAADGRPIYWRGDSHWLPLGEVIFAQETVRRLDPALGAASDRRDTGPEEREVDLATLLGSPRRETAAGWRISRPGVVTTATLDRPWRVERRSTSTATGSSPALVREPTVLVGDSFGSLSVRQLAPYFSRLTFVHRARLPVAERVQAIRDARVVVVEVVERDFGTSSAALVEPAVLDELERVLRAAPLSSRS